MRVILVDSATDTTRYLDVEPQPMRNLRIELPLMPPREITTSPNDDKQPGETDYIAFLVFCDKEDHAQAWRETVPPGDKNSVAQLLHAIFSTAEVEPELACELINLDGASVVRIDLDPHLPRHYVLVPERYYHP